MGSAPRQGNRQTALIFNCSFGKTIKKFRQITTYYCATTYTIQKLDEKTLITTS